MATTHLSTPSLASSLSSRAATKQFVFNSASHILRIGTERAGNLQELLDAIRACPESSIFQHMFQTLAEHHFIREGFSNDFAHWAFFACNETALAEQLAGIDVRAFTSIAAMRQRIIDVVEPHLKKNPSSGTRPALETFYFCSSDTVVIPTTMTARTLPEFIAGLQKVSLHSIHYHFINARLRTRLDSNDFSVWLSEELHLPQLADRIEALDIYTSTLDGVRRAMVRLAEEASLSESKSTGPSEATRTGRPIKK